MTVKDLVTYLIMTGDDSATVVVPGYEADWTELVAVKQRPMVMNPRAPTYFGEYKQQKGQGNVVVALLGKRQGELDE